MGVYIENFARGAVRYSILPVVSFISQNMYIWCVSSDFCVVIKGLVHFVSGQFSERHIQNCTMFHYDTDLYIVQRGLERVQRSTTVQQFVKTKDITTGRRTQRMTDYMSVCT